MGVTCLGRHSVEQEGKRHGWDDGEYNFLREPNYEALHRAKTKKTSQKDEERNIFSEPKRDGNPSASLMEKQGSLPRKGEYLPSLFPLRLHRSRWSVGSVAASLLFFVGHGFTSSSSFSFLCSLLQVSVQLQYQPWAFSALAGSLHAGDRVPVLFDALWNNATGKADPLQPVVCNVWLWSWGIQRRRCVSDRRSLPACGSRTPWMLNSAPQLHLPCYLPQQWQGWAAVRLYPQAIQQQHPGVSISTMSDATALTKALPPWVTVDFISMEPVFLHPNTHVGVHVLLWSSLLLTFVHSMLQALEPFRWATSLSTRTVSISWVLCGRRRFPRLCSSRGRSDLGSSASQLFSKSTADITFQGQLGFAPLWGMRQLLASLSCLPAFNICSSWNSRDQAAIQGVGFTDPKVTWNPVPWTKKVLPLRIVVYVGLGLSGLALLSAHNPETGHMIVNRISAFSGFEILY